ncbi:MULTISPECIES: DUF2188 domain-containing protein [Ciceribacter]|uniref:Uncharacterized protein DUF2188 n=2 Tax=Ciceribacter TaxID=1648508 RepID=A0A6I7HTN3_9HYPH|nr:MULTISPECIES: DUF2188 domain-containing protein [Ciceribacter]MCO6178874.1 DUF2188 domain-containing protein [Ciceribacter sp. RN22]RCW28259.1 uncharacterized protein DUF2188 [Ciceribacter lividus]RYC11948.1 DUF2188 domain-containing protein [Ciceribacter ferrooxidans]HLP69194.1 DUF2188 domain-containing protein [Rhizobium sp.]
MVKVTYEIVPHDGGWAYKLGDVYSETFASHDEALEAVRIVVQEQQVGDEPVEISYQDESGKWREEYSDGGDRPEVEIIDRFRPGEASV